MARPTDFNLDPPDEPKTTLEQDLIAAVDALLNYCEQHPTIRETLNAHFAALRAIRNEMTADDLPEYDDAIETDPAQVAEWVKANTNATESLLSILARKVDEASRGDEEVSDGTL